MTRILFYPCCGNDLQEAIEFGLSKGVEEFWFVDINFEWDVNGLSKFTGENILSKRDYVLSDPDGKWQAPVEEVSFNRFNIKLVRGKGYSIFQNFIDELSIFFYRGDSMGEGGSRTVWLGPNIFPKVLEKFSEVGWIATDGSNGTMSGAFKRLAKFHNQREKQGGEALQELSSFSSTSSKIEVDIIFTPEQCLSNRYGPTIVWKVEKNHV